MYVHDVHISQANRGKGITYRASWGWENEPSVHMNVLTLTTLGLRYLAGQLHVGEEEILTCVFHPGPVTLAKDDSGEHVIPPVARRLL